MAPAFFRREFVSIKSLTREVGEPDKDVLRDNLIKVKDALHATT